MIRAGSYNANKFRATRTDPARSDEFAIQCAVVQHLMLRAAPSVVWLAIPNGEYRSARTGARLKAQGVVAGAPDLLIIANGIPYGLEIKTTKGRQSPAQRAMEAAWNAAGGQYAVAKGLDEALALLTAWGCLRREPTREVA